jgi:putative FmdB family regulatory protein
MPIRFYAPATGRCKLCGEGFEHRERADVPSLTACPRCGQPVVRKVVQRANSPKLLAPLSVSNAKSAGFTVLKRTARGEFEKQ